MHIYNKTILVSNLSEIIELLNNNDDVSLYNCKCIYDTRVAIQHYNGKHKINNIDKNVVNIWKTNSLFDYWYTDYTRCGKKFIGCFDYTIHDYHIKINHLSINDGENYNLYDDPLDIDDSEDLIKACINFVKIVAKNENKNKIIMDLHSNLLLYEKYYSYEGFTITNRKSLDNPYWFESEINL
jgi:hypothetical protein